MTDYASELEIFEPKAGDYDAIAAMTVAAFEQEFGSGDSEAKLIEALRSGGDVVVELAARARGEIVGHILFSRMSDEPFTGKIAGLAPMCARIGQQKMGIGSALARAGLDACRAKGIRAVFVLGDSDYYGRFGFSASLANRIICAYAGEHFQALELQAGALRGIKRVEYASAFDGT